MFRKFRRSFVGLAALAVTLAAPALIMGCASSGTQVSPGAKTALKEVAKLAVSRYVREHADSERIARIHEVLVELQQLPDTEITTVDALKAVVQARIESQVANPLDRRDLVSLLNIVAPLLQDYVGTGDLLPEQVVKVRDFLSDLSSALVILG